VLTFQHWRVWNIVMMKTKVAATTTLQRQKERASTHAPVILATVDKEGRSATSRSNQTPDSRVSNPMVEALDKWVRPGSVEQPAHPGEGLLGMPL